ncbi:MAG: YfhO family protein [Vicinamibacterales bacterium]
MTTPTGRVAIAAVALVGVLGGLYLTNDVHFALNNDAIFFSHNKAQVVRQAIRSGEWPLWNRLEGGGLDLVAEGSKDFLMAPLLLVMDAKSYLVLGGFVWLGASIVAFFWFATSLGLAPWASLVGASIWATNGFALWHLHELNQQTVLVWWPVVLGAIATLDREPRRARLWLVVAAAAGLSYGRLELSEFIYGSAVLFIAICVPAGRRWPSLAATVGYSALGALVVSWFLIPYVGAILGSARAAAVRGPAYLSGGAVLAHFLPSLDTGVASRAYVALTAWPLAALGWGRHRRLGVFAVCLGLTYSLLAYDTGVFPLVQRLPLHAANWNVERHLVFASFALALLAACGLDGLLRGDVRERRVWLVFGATLVVCGLLSVVAAEEGEVPAAARWWNVAQLTSCVVLVLFFALSVRRAPRLVGLAATLAASGALVFGFGFDRQDRNDGELAALEATYAERLAGRPSVLASTMRARAPEQPFRVGHEFDWHPAFLSGLGLASLGYYSPFVDKGLVAYESARRLEEDSHPAQGSPRERVLGRLAAERFVCTRREDVPASWARLDTLGVPCFERRDFLPYYRLVRRAEVVPDAAVLAILTNRASSDPDWFDRGVILDAALPGSGAEAGGGSDGRVSVTSIGTNEVELAVETVSDAILVAAERFDQGWRATVDGRPVPLARANAIFQAVPVPAGTHVVRFVYRPRRFVAGLALSLAGIGLSAACLRRPPKSPGSGMRRAVSG